MIDKFTLRRCENHATPSRPCLFYRQLAHRAVGISFHLGVNAVRNSIPFQELPVGRENKWPRREEVRTDAIIPSYGGVVGAVCDCDCHTLIRHAGRAETGTGYGGAADNRSE